MIDGLRILSAIVNEVVYGRLVGKFEHYSLAGLGQNNLVEIRKPDWFNIFQYQPRESTYHLDALSLFGLPSPTEGTAMTITDTPIVEVPTAAVIMERDLRQQIEVLNQRLTLTNRQLIEAHDDLELIAKRIVEEGRARDWCSEYEDWRKHVNRDTNGDWLLPMSRKIRFNIRVVVDVETTDPDETVEHLHNVFTDLGKEHDVDCDPSVNVSQD